MFCRICREVLLPEQRRGPCHHWVLQPNLYRCPPHSHCFASDPTLDCVAKITVDSFNDQEVQRCAHPNIVKHIMTSRLNKEEVVVVTEYCKGGNLFGWVHGDSQGGTRGRFGRPISDDHVVSLLVQLLLALHHLHKLNIMHRDVSINNVFISSVRPDSRLLVLLGDFGLSKVTTQASVGDDNFHSTCGTQPYMAPEVKAKEPVYNATADIYAVGAVVFEYAVGRPPFSHGQDGRFGDQQRAQLSAALLSPEVINVLEHLLAYDQADRPTTVGVFMSHPVMVDGLRLYMHRFATEEGVYLNNTPGAVTALSRQEVVLSTDPRVPPSLSVGRMRKVPIGGQEKRTKEIAHVFVHEVIGIWAIREKNPSNVHFLDAQDISDCEIEERNSGSDDDADDSPLGGGDSDDDEANPSSDETCLIEVRNRLRTIPYVYGTNDRVQANWFVELVLAAKKKHAAVTQPTLRITSPTSLQC